MNCRESAEPGQGWTASSQHTVVWQVGCLCVGASVVVNRYVGIRLWKKRWAMKWQHLQLMLFIWVGQDCPKVKVHNLETQYGRRGWNSLKMQSSTHGKRCCGELPSMFIDYRVIRAWGTLDCGHLSCVSQQVLLKRGGTCPNHCMR